MITSNQIFKNEKNNFSKDILVAMSIRYKQTPVEFLADCFESVYYDCSRKVAEKAATMVNNFVFSN